MKDTLFRKFFKIYFYINKSLFIFALEPNKVTSIYSIFQKKKCSQNMSLPIATIYEQNDFSLDQFLAPKPINVNSSLGQLKNQNTQKIFNTSSSIKCMKNIMKNYSIRQKDRIQKQHRKYVKSLVKNIYGRLVGYSMHQKTIKDLFQNQNKRNKENIVIQPSQVIYLERKYNIELSIKYANLKQSQDIDESKSKIKQKKAAYFFQQQPLIRKMKSLIKNINVNQTQNQLENKAENQILYKNPLQNTKLIKFQYPISSGQNYHKQLKQGRFKQRKSQKLQNNNLFFPLNEQKSRICVKPQSKMTLFKKNKLKKSPQFNLLNISNMQFKRQNYCGFNSRKTPQKSCYDVYNNYL